MIFAENILICIAIPLLITLFFIKGNVRKMLLSLVTGMGLCLLAAYIGGFLEYTFVMNAEETSIFISPVTEEIIKLFPVMFALLLFDPTDEELSIIALGIGAGFATFENCCNLISTGSENLAYVLIRGFSTGVMHVVSIFALSLALIILRRYKAATVPAVVGALSFSVTFHALYNLFVSKPGLSSYIGYALPLAAAVALAFVSKGTVRFEISRE